MDLKRYLRRIGYTDEPRPDLATLTAIHRRHALSVPFENLDVQLGIPLSTGIDAAYEKIVDRARGGWCYEQNGLLGWALQEIGFDVTRLAAAVRGDERGESARNNHLCLLVRTQDGGDVAYLADVGFGGSLLEPVPLAQAKHHQPPYRVALVNRGEDRWRFTESAPGAFNYFDFRPVAADEAALSAKCADLQSNPASGFVTNFVAQRRLADAHVSLRGRVLTTMRADGFRTRLIRSDEEFLGLLRSPLGLDVAGAAELWPLITARHSTLFGT